MIKIKCVYCGKKFEVPNYRKDAKFCSKECFHKHQTTASNPLRRRDVVVCKNCGKRFEKHTYETTEYCSRDCYWDYRRKHPDVLFQTNQAKNLVKKICINCGKEYEVFPYRVETSKFCSVECHDGYRQDKIVCKTCGKKFSSPKWEKRKYCCEQCAVIGIDKRNSAFSKSVHKFLLDEDIFDIKKDKLLKGEDKKIYPDFIINNKLVIECNGDYWHCNPKVYDRDYFNSKIQKYAYEIWEKEEERTKILKEKGYEVIILWEYDWNNDKEFFKNLKKYIYEICSIKKNKPRKNKKNNSHDSGKQP